MDLFCKFNEAVELNKFLHSDLICRLLEWIFRIEGTCGKIYVFFLELLSYDKPLILMSGVVASFMTYWTVSGLFLFFDLTHMPSFLLKYKIQPQSNDPVDKDKLRKAICVVLFNQLVLNTVIFASIVLAFEYFELWDRIDMKVPSFPRLMTNLIACVLIYDVIFYFSHRLMHHRLIYKHVHKIHHEWTAPIAAIALYCHPVEHIFCNAMPLSGVFILRTDLASAIFFVEFVVISTCIGHSGLHLPFLISPEFHDFHHRKYNECYSTDGLMDWIFGTSKNFLQSDIAKRHKVLLGFEGIKPIETSEKQLEKSKQIQTSLEDVCCYM